MKLKDWVKQEIEAGRQPIVLVQPVTATSWVYVPWKGKVK